MKVIFSIHGREAIPVRAIPLLTNWKTMNPDMVAMALAWDDDFHQFNGLCAYPYENGNIGNAVDATWWENFPRRKLKALSERIRATQISHETGYGEWRSKSLPILPAGVFVWKDEFEPRYAQKYGREGTTFFMQSGGGKMAAGEQARRVTLNYNPFTDDLEARRCVMEGFEPSAMNGSSNSNGRVLGADNVPQQAASVTADTTAPPPATEGAVAPPGAPVVDVPVTEPTQWKMRIQMEAADHMKTLRGSGANPTVRSILERMATWCRDNEVKTDSNNFPSANYLRTHVLGGRHWQPPR